MDEKPKCSRDLEPLPQSSTQKDEAFDTKERSSVQKTQVLLLKDQPATSKDESFSSKLQPTLPKYQATPTVTTSLANSSERQSLTIVESGMSFCVARVASTTLPYNRNSCLNSYGPLIIRPSFQSPITTQPCVNQLPFSAPTTVAVPTQPQSLFLQALSKLKDSSLSLSVLSNIRLLRSSSNLSKTLNFDLQSGEITPPDSLTSAPPSYSFVLRQMAVRRRPRFMGTFFPSPSFVQHTPPPAYTTAFDVYIEPAVPQPPARVYTFGFASMPIVCPECGYTGMTVVTSRITLCTHLCAFILCLLCCWICAPLPYILRSCKDVYHYCRNCRSFLGMYCPTNPESIYP